MLNIRQLVGRFAHTALAFGLLGTSAYASQGTIVMPATYNQTTLNAGLLALMQGNSGSTAPANGPGSAPTMFQTWWDTSTTLPTIRFYDGAQWPALGQLDATNHWMVLTPSVISGENTTGVSSIITLNPMLELHHNLSGTNIPTSADGPNSFHFAVDNDSMNTTSGFTGGTCTSGPCGPGTHNGLWVGYNIGGTGLTGHRTVVAVSGAMTNPSSNPYPNSPFFYTGQGIRMVTSTPDHSGATQASGAWGGLNVVVQLSTGATFWQEQTGVEIDLTAQTGTSVQYKQALKIVSYGADVTRGSIADMAIGIAADSSGSATGFACGLCFGTYDGRWAFTSTSTLIGTYQYNGSETLNALNGIDLSSVTFSGAAFKSNNFNVDANGNVSIGSSLGYLIGGITRLGGDANYTQLFDAGGRQAIYLGTTGGGASQNTYDNTLHVFRDRTPTGKLTLDLSANELYPNTTGGIALGDSSHRFSSVNANSYAANGSSGVSCSGSPTASFAAVGGIVTHC